MNTVNEGGNRGKGRGRGSWRGRGGPGGARPAVPSAGRPTHFLALPLHTNDALRARVSAFQNALFTGEPTEPVLNVPESSATGPSRSARTMWGKKKPKISTIVEGLDASIVIDPRRLHMTLGVMALELEEEEVIPSETLEKVPSMLPGLLDSQTSREASTPSNGTSSKPRRTASTALALLQSLQPQISAILSSSSGIHVPLEVLDVLKTTRIKPPQLPAETEMKNTSVGVGGNIRKGSSVGSSNIFAESATTHGEGLGEKVGAGVLFVGPKHVEQGDENIERTRLREVCDLIFRAFKDNGYITDTRPLKLHCTILNASHRKPARRAPFSYTDILAASHACVHLGTPLPPGADDEMAILETTVIGNASRSELSLLEPLPFLSTPMNTTSLPSSRLLTSVSAAVVEDELDLGVPAPSSLLPLPKTSPPPQGPPTSQQTTMPPHQQQTKTSRYPRGPTVPPPQPIALGTYRVDEVQLWVMGSHGPNNEYVSCGGVRLE